MKRLDLDHWPRREHFHFFRQFSEPFFGVTVRIDCTEAYRYCERSGESFFLHYLHKCLAAVNGVEAFRYRVEGDQVVVHDVIHASATIGREDGSFGFSYILFHPDVQQFVTGARAEIGRVRETRGLDVGVAGADVIHFSAVPWLDFTGLSHARHHGRPDSCPKISVGKMTERDGRLRMPVSIHGHHGLMDGREVGQFVDLFQELMLTSGPASRESETENSTAPGR
ncbi:chloramphenicol O-acetyltransferase type A [Lewinella aquimaris]|uniref:Chloramphenicol O-acetyltransferase type A n=1 Tax=Neolewinella aquimaris TaxID=1835722 RepID=A0A840E9J4_9BACT|nr:chloramphenicol acetyltransferase [Neolewinella aquimaris]MBB4078479.1 chloramphenicol O-acetyltransferase type A [Neolewinella aquimaris]